MRPRTIPAIFLLVAVLLGGIAARQRGDPAADKQRPAFKALPRKYQTLLTAWINQDCRVDSATIEEDMASAGPVLEEALWEAVDLGPTAEDRADLQRSLGDRYALRLRWLLQNRPEAVDSSLTKQLLAESEEQFVAMEMAKLNERWRDAALTGLGFVCTDRSLERLRSIAKDEQNSASIAASEALRASVNCARSRRRVSR